MPINDTKANQIKEIKEVWAFLYFSLLLLQGKMKLV